MAVHGEADEADRHEAPASGAVRGDVQRAVLPAGPAGKPEEGMGRFAHATFPNAAMVGGGQAAGLIQIKLPAGRRKKGWRRVGPLWNVKASGRRRARRSAS